MPDCAIFADTGWELPAIYENVKWLESVVPFPVYTVTMGRSLKTDVQNLKQYYGEGTDIPVFMKSEDGKNVGMSRRQCTKYYKIYPVRKKVRELLGVRRVVGENRVEMWQGISTDEAERMKDSDVKWEKRRYPLIELGMSRDDCLDWWNERYSWELKRSACVGCPYKSRLMWVQTKRNYPQDFQDVVDMDYGLRREESPLPHESYFHPTAQPLDKAVEFDEDVLVEHLGEDFFVNQCEGYCGV